VHEREHQLRSRLARNVRARRKALGMTLADAEEDSAMDGGQSISWRHWQKVEAGEVNFTGRTLVRLAAALRCEVLDLLAPVSAVNAEPRRTRSRVAYRKQQSERRAGAPEPLPKR
jgi:transcriptional regulator with XRE-family HTH domain